jgi:hypothetical protein
MDLTVMAYATLGLSLFVSAIKVGDWILNADPRAIINAGRWALVAFVVLALIALLWLIASGRWTGAMMLAAFLLPVFVQAAPRWRVLFAPLHVGFPPAAGSVTTPGGVPAGRGATDPELVQQSIAVLRAYLEQADQQIAPRPTSLRIGSAAVNGSGDSHRRMSAAEALDVLGLKPAASAQEIMDAHHRLEQKVDPTLGGTHYLSMKIDEARDVLLGQRAGFS